MITPSIEHINGSTVVRLEGPATIDTAASIHQTFVQAVEHRMPIALDLSHLTECDATFLQITSSLCRSVQRQGNHVSLVNTTIPDEAHRVIRSLGFDCMKECGDASRAACFLAALTETAGGGN